MAAGLLNNNAKLAGMLTGAGQIGAAVLPYAMSEGRIGDLKQLGTTLGSQASNIAEQSAEQAAFQPFAVKTGTGTNTQLSQATTDLGIVPQLETTFSDTEDDLSTGLFTQAQTLTDAALPTAKSLYDQIRAMQMPEEERQRLAMQNSMFNQGRSGVQTAAYGGTPEQLAFQKAVQEAQNAASFQAAQLAPQMQASQIGNIAGLMGAAYLPQNQAVAGMQPGLDMARIAQMGAQGQAEALYKGGIAGLEAQASAATAAANVEAARTQALSNALSGMFARPDYAGGVSAGEDFFSKALGYFNPETPASAVPIAGAKTLADLAKVNPLYGYYGTPAANAPTGQVDIT